MRKQSLRKLVTTDTIAIIRSSGYAWNDIPAIRTISNDVIDNLIRDGSATEDEAVCMS